MKKHNILWGCIFVTYIIFGFLAINHAVYSGLEKDYELKKDLPLAPFSIVAFAPFEEDFITYRLVTYNETWTYTNDGLLQRVG